MRSYNPHYISLPQIHTIDKYLSDAQLKILRQHVRGAPTWQDKEPLQGRKSHAVVGTITKRLDHPL